ncbi:hypothetical protein ACK8HX_12595 [Oryzobacter sp. R7]|uniref:hypothetical protein n=1 Tax=Oryzobacter faecalis TaxID=3388656 RepID=UPI00398CE46A
MRAPNTTRSPSSGRRRAIVHADHAQRARDDGPTSYVNGNGACARCNLVQEAPGWSVAVRDPLASPGTEADARELVVTTGVGLRYSSVPPPLLGWGSTPGVERLPGHALRAPASAAVRPGAGRVVRGRRVSQRPAKRPLLTSRLERELCRSLT